MSIRLRKKALEKDRVEFINESHFPILQEFWNGRNYPPLLKEIIPDIGFMSYVDDQPICSTFFYTDGKSVMSFMAWIAIKAGVKPEIKSQAFNAMCEMVRVTAEEMGVKVIYCQANNASLMKRLQDNGFIGHDTDMVDMMKVI